MPSNYFLILFMKSALIFKPFLTILTLTAGLALAAQNRCVVSFHSSYSASYVKAFVVDAVDEPPQFPGGDTELMNYINSERRYPRDAYDAGISGRVQCSFVINTDGSINEISVFRGVCPSLDHEALRIIANMPKWKPGRIGDEKVPVFYMLTIPFRL